MPGTQHRRTHGAWPCEPHAVALASPPRDPAPAPSAQPPPRSKKSAARVGRIHTPHGVIDTPGFVAVGTNAALKAVDGAWADAEGLQLMFCNTYHLLLHPGPEVVAGAGGLHAFMGRRDRPLITDSGGFQVFSLAYGTVHEEVNELKRSQGPSKHKTGNLMKGVTEEGVRFCSYRWEGGRKGGVWGRLLEPHCLVYLARNCSLASALP